MSLPRPFQTGGPSRKGLANFLALLFGAVLLAATGHAQTQETGTLDRILHPDRTLKFDDSDKQFGVSSAVGGKQATVKAYSFGAKGSVFNGDGKFRTKNFNNPKDGGFRTEGYSAKTSQVSLRNSFAQADREFGTKAMAVREAPAANKSAAVRDFIPANQTYVMRGKRQDTMDDMTKNNKDMTIDQVRDLLNKGPEAKR